MSEVLGKCPKCGQDVVTGQYGPYCTGKCGMTLSKAFGKTLSDDEVSSLLKGDEVLLDGCLSKKSPGHTFSIYAKMTGTEDYEYTKKDGSVGHGTRMKFETRFDNEGGAEAKVLGKCPNCGQDVVTGKYGAYCKGKCGFSISKAFKKDLSEAQITDLLAGKELLLKGLVKVKDDGSESKYDMYIKGEGAESYTYTKKDGTEGSGYRMRFATRFPNDGAKDPAPAPKPGITEDDSEAAFSDDMLPFG